jgi:L-threonylcarbamoyladenylate synthase
MLSGGVVAYPTETFYGLGADPFQEKALERVYAIKGRDFGKPLPLIASDIASARGVAGDWPLLADRLAERFWPGPLTLVVEASARLPVLLHAGTGKIAVRVSPHGAARALAAGLGGAIVATSANRAGEPARDDPRRLSSTILSGVDGLIDAGKTVGGRPSTMVDATVSPPRLLRAGALRRAEVEEFLKSRL